MNPSSNTPIWLGSFKKDDTAFRIYVDNTQAIERKIQKLAQRRHSVKKQLSRALQNNSPIDATVIRLRERYPLVALGEILAELANEDSCRDKLAELHATTTFKSKATADTIKNFGLGEMVFISPEGPHATAGGLGQVTTGLLPSLASAGLPVTLVAPLYSQKFGNKHRDAWLTVRDGIRIDNSYVYPKYAGEITVSIPPSYSISSGNLQRYPTSIPLQVYEAYHASVRLLLLFNPIEFDSLYSALPPDRQIRRSVLFSRGALEVISNRLFDIQPSFIISNDWMTAIVPALSKLDPRYSSNSSIQSAKCIHVLHNAGRDYHGIFPTQVADEDLWGLFGLSGEHFFGFQDPLNPTQLNLSHAGVLHADSVLTVSSEYAGQIKHGEETAELSFVLNRKGDNFGGISNGINTELVRRAALSSIDIHNKNKPTLEDIRLGKLIRKREVQTTFGLSSGENYPPYNHYRVDSLSRKDSLSSVMGGALVAWESLKKFF